MIVAYRSHGGKIVDGKEKYYTPPADSVRSVKMSLLKVPWL